MLRSGTVTSSTHSTLGMFSTISIPFQILFKVNTYKWFVFHCLWQTTSLVQTDLILSKNNSKAVWFIQDRKQQRASVALKPNARLILKHKLQNWYAYQWWFASSFQVVRDCLNETSLNLIKNTDKNLIFTSPWDTKNQLSFLIYNIHYV